LKINHSVGQVFKAVEDSSLYSQKPTPGSYSA